MLGALAIWIGLGLWSGLMPQVPMALGPGIVLGAVAGVVSAYVVLHDFHRRPRLTTNRGRRKAH